MPKPLKKQEPFENVCMVYHAGVIRVGKEQRGEWVAFWFMLVLAAVAAVFATRWVMSPGIDGVGKAIIAVLFCAIIVLPLLWGILWRLAFRYELWLYIDECVAERRWMWHKRRYDGEWIDLTGGALDITGGRMSVNSNDPSIGPIVALGCLSALLGPVGVIASAFLAGTQRKKINKRVPILVVRREDDSVEGLALFMKNKDARVVINMWHKHSGMDRN